MRLSQFKPADRRAVKSVLRTYASYNFRDKNPIIFVVRDLRKRTGMSYQDIADRGGPSVSTQYKWDYGDTRRPQHDVSEAAIRAMGFRTAVIDNKRNIVKVIDPEREEPRLAVRKRKRNGKGNGRAHLKVVK